MKVLKSEKQDTSHMENTYKIYYVWVGPNEMPDQCKRYVETWSKIKGSQIIQIGNEQPIIAQGFKEAVYWMQEDQPKKVRMTLCKMYEPVRYHHQMY